MTLPWDKTILVNGTTGEFFNMTVQERRGVLEFCRKYWSGQVITHVGAAAIGDAIDLADHARCEVGSRRGSCRPVSCSPFPNRT